MTYSIQCIIKKNKNKFETGLLHFPIYHGLRCYQRKQIQLNKNILYNKKVIFVKNILLITKYLQNCIVLNTKY